MKPPCVRTFFSVHATVLTGAALMLYGAAAGPAAAQTQAIPDAASTPATLPAIEVVGRLREDATTYHATESVSAKTDLPLRELPQSVQVITEQTIDDLSATKLDEVLDYVSGVTRNNNFGGLHDGVLIRGLPGGRSNFGAEALLNGFSSSRGYPMPRDLAGVERVEFLKGPSAALYGSGSPGGLLNIVSKRPLWSAAHAVSTTFGSYGLKRGAFDSGGPLGKSLAYRLNAAVEEGGSFRDHINPRRQVLAPALTWNLDADTVLEYVGEIVRHQAPIDRGVVAVNGQLGTVPRNRFFGEPADGSLHLKNSTHQFILSHDWNPQWRSRFGASYRKTGVDGYSSPASSTASGLLPDGTLTRGYEWFDFRGEDLMTQAELQGKFQTASIEHELLLGMEGYRYEKDDLFLLSSSADPYPINIYDPIYGQTPPALLPWRNSLERHHNLAFYAQDVVKLAEDWRIMVGLRHDRHRQNLLNRYTNAVAGQRRTSATSPRVGLSWLATPQWTVYLSGSQSFMPNSGVGFDGSSFKPEKGRAMEGGVKWENAARTLGVTLALFDIRKRDILTADANNPGFSINAGEVRSRGVELDVSGQITQHWRITANASWLDPKVRRDNNLAVGTLITNAARVSSSALLMYENQFANGQRYSVGGGVVHVGRRLGQNRTRNDVNNGVPAFYLPAYTTAKLMASWHLNAAVRLSLDVDNLFDKTYYVSSWSSTWVAPGAPRTITASVQAKF